MSRVRRLLVTWLTGALFATVIVVGGAAPTAGADHVEPPAGAGQQFMWPVSAWVGANDHYASGGHHSGSADLSIAQFTPIRAARAGEVVFSGYRSGAYGVRIRHDAGDKTYVTQYGHMATPPPVREGAQVGLGTIIGYVGRTGHAFLGGPHIHFAIRVMKTSEYDRFGGKAMKIPGLDIASWVRDSDFIPGVYDGLSPIEWLSDRTFQVRVTAPDVRAYATTARRTGELVAELAPGSTHRVLDTSRGQYQVEVAGKRGWIAHSGTKPVASTLFNIRVTAGTSAAVRRTPTGTGDLIGVIPADKQRYLSAFERGGANGDWVRVLWTCNATTNRSDDAADDGRALGGCPGRTSGSYAKYGWMGPAVTDPTSQFTTRTRVARLNVHGNRVVGGTNWPDSSVKLGELGAVSSPVHVLGIRNGWYRVGFNGQTGWVRGWFTPGPH